MNKNTYDVVKLFVGKGNFVAEKVVEFLNNEDPGNTCRIWFIYVSSWAYW